MPERRLSGTTVLLRADAGPDVGLGHLMRCVALAEGLRERGAAAAVLMSDNGIGDDALEGVRRGVPIERQRHAPLEEDARLTVAAARRLNAGVIVTDMCSGRHLSDPAALDAYHAELRRHAKYLVVFAGGRHLDPVADVVVNPYLLPRDEATGADPYAPRVLWGPQYFVFRPEFVRAAALPRRVAPAVRRVAVSVGGSDPAGLTPRIVEALAAVAPRDLEVRVVLGPGVEEAERDRVVERVAPFAPRWRAIGPPDDMAALFLWSDLAITGDGLTKYETAVTGTPSIIVARPDSSARINREFVAAGTTVCVEPGPDGRWAALAGTIRRLLETSGEREAMARRGRELLDGRGVERVLDRIAMVKVA